MNEKLPDRLAGWAWRRQWLPRELRKRAYKRLSRQHQGPDAPFRMDFFGLEYHGNLRNNVEFAMNFYGAFEKPLLYFMRDVIAALKAETTSCCDIGANIGQHTLFLSRFADHVHAFEPFSGVSSRLRYHIELNRIDNISLHEVGLSNSTGRLPFFAPTGGNQGIGSFLDASTRKGNAPIGELAIARGDEYFSEHGIEEVDLMKIDVEGLERQVLEGLGETLRRDRPVVICELTYGESHSFPDEASLRSSLPDDYELYIFDTRKADGSTARRRGARAKRSGLYRLQKLSQWRDQDQDDIVAIPREKLNLIALSSVDRSCP